jgi:hypothetical protein
VTIAPGVPLSARDSIIADLDEDLRSLAVIGAGECLGSLAQREAMRDQGLHLNLLALQCMATAGGSSNAA